MVNGQKSESVLSLEIPNVTIEGLDRRLPSFNGLGDHVVILVRPSKVYLEEIQKAASAATEVFGKAGLRSLCVVRTLDPEIVARYAKRGATGDEAIVIRDGVFYRLYPKPAALGVIQRIIHRHFNHAVFPWIRQRNSPPQLLLAHIRASLG